MQPHTNSLAQYSVRQSSGKVIIIVNRIEGNIMILSNGLAISWLSK